MRHHRFTAQQHTAARPGPHHSRIRVARLRFRLGQLGAGTPPAAPGSPRDQAAEGDHRAGRAGRVRRCGRSAAARAPHQPGDRGRGGAHARRIGAITPAARDQPVRHREQVGSIRVVRLRSSSPYRNSSARAATANSAAAALSRAGARSASRSRRPDPGLPARRAAGRAGPIEASRGRTAGPVGPDPGRAPRGVVARARAVGRPIGSCAATAVPGGPGPSARAARRGTAGTTAPGPPTTGHRAAHRAQT